MVKALRSGRNQHYWRGFMSRRMYFFLINLFLSIYTLRNHKIANKLTDYLNEYLLVLFQFWTYAVWFLLYNIILMYFKNENKIMLHNFWISSHRSKILHTNIYFFDIIFQIDIKWVCWYLFYMVKYIFLYNYYKCISDSLIIFSISVKVIYYQSQFIRRCLVNTHDIINYLHNLFFNFCMFASSYML